jgi:hypothetical protein
MSIPVAPCGLNCSCCRAYLRPNNKCPGCREDDARKPVTRVNCKIKTCAEIPSGRQFCGGCGAYPCAALKQLDKRYRTRYGLSAIANLASIEDAGIEAFLAADQAKWTCPGCGGTVCMHTGQCSTCGKAKLGAGDCQRLS